MEFYVETGWQGTGRQKTQQNFSTRKEEGRKWKVRGTGSDVKNQTRDRTRTWRAEPKLEVLLEIKKGGTVWGRNR